LQYETQLAFLLFCCILQAQKILHIFAKSAASAYYDAQKVCLSVCLSYSSGAIAQSWTPTTAFQSLSLKYVCLHLAPHFPDGQPKGKELSC